MADVLVQGATISGGRVQKLRVRMHRIEPRTIDRDTAVQWLRDGHSLVPVIAGRRGTRIQLVEVGDDVAIRMDNQAVAEDALPGVGPA